MNVKFLKNGMPYGYSYFAGESGYVDPEKTIEVWDTDAKGKQVQIEMNFTTWATRNGILEKL